MSTNTIKIAYYTHEYEYVLEYNLNTFLSENLNHPLLPNLPIFRHYVNLRDAICKTIKTRL